MADLGDIQYVLFDWGDTLCVTAGEEPAWRKGLAELLAAARREGLQVGDGHMDSLVELFLRTRAEANADPEHREIQLTGVLRGWIGDQALGEVSDASVDSMSEAYWGEWIGCLSPIEGAAETLDQLRDRGYRVGLVSNVTAPAYWCRVQLERMGLWDRLDSVTFSSEVGLRKPHPSMFEDAFRKIGGGRVIEPGRVLFVGDSLENDIVGAAAQGMRTVLVGSTDGLGSADGVSGAQPDRIVAFVAELLPDLLGPK